MCRKDPAVTQEAGPDYQRLMALIRSRIASGEYPTGEKIPSTSDWIKDGWSRDTTRTAITRLQRDGVLKGHEGKGVFVAATPEQAAQERISLETLQEQVAETRTQITDLIERVGRLEAAIATSLGRSRGGRREQAKAAADGGRR
jgi:DNA-binding GntR family transcriptional regulator